MVQGEAVSAQEDTVLLFDPGLLLANDRDPDGDTLRITSIDAVLHGSVRMVAAPDGTPRIEFTPDPEYAGLAGFRYVVSDGTASAHGQVQVELAPVNDAPAATGESFTGVMDTRYTFTPEALLANDTDAETPTGLRLVRVGPAAHGTVSLTEAGVVFDPEPGYAGPAGFSYTVADAEGATAAATVRIDLARTNHPPRAADDSFHVNEDPGTVLISFDQLLANDTDPDTPATGERLTIEAITPQVPGAGTYELDPVARTVRFVPAPDYHGPADFLYRASDGRGGSAEATARVTVHAVNDAPVVLGDDPAPKEPTPWGPHRGRFLATDVDGPGPITWELARAPDRGSVSLNTATGDWLYDPRGEKGGQTTFTVVATDGVDRTPFHMTLAVGTYGYPFVDSSADGGPVVVDLAGDGIDLVGAADSVAYADFGGDGRIERIGWVAGDDALLAWDHDRDGAVRRIDEISLARYQPGATSDLEGLRAFDSNRDGWFDAADARWSEFGLLAADGAFTPISDTQVAGISLARGGEAWASEGNTVLGTSPVRLDDGSTTQAGDVVLGAQAAAADEAADLARRAQVFLAWAASSPAAEPPPLTFTPLPGDADVYAIDPFLPLHDPAGATPGRPA